MRVIGYQYDADQHCISCTLDYAREVPYSEYVFGEYSDEDISSSPGFISLTRAIELEVIRDSENNPIHAMMETDERPETTHCGECGDEIE